MRKCRFIGFFYALFVSGLIYAGGDKPVLFHGINNSHKEYRFQLLQGFEEAPRYRVINRKAMQGYTRLIKRTAYKEKARSEYFKRNNRLYRAETAAFTLPESRFSLEARGFIKYPGHDTIMTAPEEPVKISGRPLSISLWLKGDGSHNRLQAVFSLRATHTREVDLADLSEKKWRRIEVKLPPDIYRRDRNRPGRYQTTFKGFKLKSANRAERGLTLFVIDRPVILIHDPPAEFAGSELIDNWR